MILYAISELEPTEHESKKEINAKVEKKRKREAILTRIVCLLVTIEGKALSKIRDT